jgi:hypothetical protein
MAYPKRRFNTEVDAYLARFTQAREKAWEAIAASLLKSCGKLGADNFTKSMKAYKVDAMTTRANTPSGRFAVAQKPAN